jgi:nitroreductase
MEFYEVIKKRQSIRSYKSNPVPKDSLDKIAESLQYAPSACNLQPWSFRIVTNEKLKADICACYGGKWLAEAPAIIVALGNVDTCWKRPEGTPIIDIDMGIAMEHVVLAATAEGLGTCWICAYNGAEMDKAMNIMKPWSVLAVSPLGYPDTLPERKEHKPKDEIFKIID